MGFSPRSWHSRESPTSPMSDGKNNNGSNGQQQQQQRQPPPPPTFVCPLTRQVMQDPVMDHCAHNFERSAIVKLLQQQENKQECGCCPISGKPLSLDELITNDALAERIEKWQWKRDNASLFQEEKKVLSPASGAGVKNDARTVPTAEIDHAILHGDEDRSRDDDTEEGSFIVQTNSNNNQYGEEYAPQEFVEIPGDLMYLPQERHVFYLMRARAAEQLATRRKEKLFCFTLLCTMMGALVLIALWGIVSKLSS